MEQLMLEGIDDVNQNKYDLLIERCEVIDSPREWDNLGQFFVKSNDYIANELETVLTNSGSESFDEVRDRCRSMSDMIDYLDTQGFYAVPVCVYSHSGYYIYLGEPCDRFDSGYIGVYLVSKDKIREEYGKKRISKALLKKVDDVFEAELKVLNQCISGDCYAYVLTDAEGNTVDSLGGLYGDNLDDILEQAKEYLPFDKSIEEIKEITTLDEDVYLS